MSRCNRWIAGGIVPLLAVLLLAPADGSVQGSEGSGERQKRVYTNDDFPESDAATPSPTTAEAGKNSANAPRPAERVAPFVPTPMEIVDRMLEMARTTAADVVYDLGSGDGRIVLRAAERFGAKAVGVELDRGLAAESAAKAREMQLDDRVRIIEGDLFQTDLSPATVVTVYLLLSTNDRLRPVLEKQLRPGARVVAHDIRIPGWQPAREETFHVDTVPHTVYLYEIPGAFRRPTNE